MDFANEGNDDDDDELEEVERYKKSEPVEIIGRKNRKPPISKG